MVYFDCATAQPGMSGTECQKSCSTLDMACVSDSSTTHTLTEIKHLDIHTMALFDSLPLFPLHLYGYRSVLAVHQAACALMAWCQMEQEAVSMRPAVHVYTMDRSTSLDRHWLWAATPGLYSALYNTYTCMKIQTLNISFTEVVLHNDSDIKHGMCSNRRSPATLIYFVEVSMKHITLWRGGLDPVTNELWLHMSEIWPRSNPTAGSITHLLD